jgi:hypothetical protein
MWHMLFEVKLVDGTKVTGPHLAVLALLLPDCCQLLPAGAAVAAVAAAAAAAAAADAAAMLSSWLQQPWALHGTPPGTVAIGGHCSRSKCACIGDTQAWCSWADVCMHRMLDVECIQVSNTITISNTINTINISQLLPQYVRGVTQLLATVVADAGEQR